MAVATDSTLARAVRDTSAARDVHRTRLLAGLQPWADARPQYRLRLGPAALPFSALTDEALLALRSRIAGDLRRERALRTRAAA